MFLKLKFLLSHLCDSYVLWLIVDRCHVRSLAMRAFLLFLGTKWQFVDNTRIKKVPCVGKSGKNGIRIVQPRSG
jgi:hypothetical protein